MYKCRKGEDLPGWPFGEEARDGEDERKSEDEQKGKDPERQDGAV